MYPLRYPGALLLLNILILIPNWGLGQDLSVLSGTSEFIDADQKVREFFIGEASRRLNHRDAVLRDLETAEQVRERQRFVLERLSAAIGQLPRRTPLNPRIVGALQRDGYRIEKVIFESQPQFFVTSNLYIPETGKPPYPGILLPQATEPARPMRTASM